MTPQGLPLQPACLRWSNRILILSVLGIIYLTLFPFQIHFGFPHPYHGSPFFLGDSSKTLRRMDFFLNVLLFVPFGFGAAAQMCKRGGRLWASALLALVAGAFTTYTVELLQLYIPGRDSGWEDVISNTMGSVVGFLLFAIAGGAILRTASRYADSFENWITPGRTALLLVIYFALSFSWSVVLQRATRLSNWDPRCSLNVGNDADGQKPWPGHVLLLQIWNRAIGEQVVGTIIKGNSGDAKAEADADLLGSYDLTGAPPYQDQRAFLPALDQASLQPQLASAHAKESDARLWLRTSLPVEKLTRAIKKSNQFTIHIVCTPPDTKDAAGRIISLSQSSTNINVHLRQEGTSLVLFFRNPLTETGSMLAWTVHDALAPGKVRDIVATYDGSDALIYLDGRRVSRIYRLSPGATLLHKFSLIKTADLDGAVIEFETLIFLPAGLLIGLQAAMWPRGKTSSAWMIALGLLVPAVLMEILLVQVSGRRVWLGNIAFSFVFALAGTLLMNADWTHFKKPGQQPET